MNIVIRSLSMLVVLASMTSIASAQSKGRDVPAPAKAEAAEIDYKALAQKRVASWQTTKVECYRETGATEGQHWQVNPSNPGDIMTHTSMWDLPASITDKVKACKAKQPK